MKLEDGANTEVLDTSMTARIDGEVERTSDPIVKSKVEF